ncbi:uncharacterized protein LOC113370014 isoform X2 [Ctenocephalides felis]|uniref:uncharacterized protein LOC113370014 isoform X2 n=1 Tax=Ctenocephalides felis TaxID=7515 RepID=UPI000E6E2953|nr:uncharacterized protein LOC113370014 isoform X2 [Ctenocephalides felis]
MHLVTYMTTVLFALYSAESIQAARTDYDHIRELYELLQAAGAGVDSGPGFTDTAGLYAARQQRKALAPSLRLRFGKRDNELEDELPYPVLESLTSELDMARRAPSMRLRFGKRYDPEQMNNRRMRLPTKVLRYGRSYPQVNARQNADTTDN